MIAGIEIEMSGRKWTIPPLTLGQLRRLGPHLGEINSGRGLLEREVVEAILKIVVSALERNYPGLAEEDAAEMLDLGNAAQVAVAVLTGSGLKAGEQPAAVRVGGTKSTASSPPLSGIGRATWMS